MLFSKRLAEARKEKGMTQKNFGEILGVAQSTIGSWENDDRKPDVEMLYKICTVLEVSADYLLGLTDL